MQKLDNLIDHLKAEKKEHSERYSMGLVDAAKDGNIDLVRSLLENGTEVDQKDTCGITSLMVACQIGIFEMVKLLLENGANPNAVDYFDLEFGREELPPILRTSDKAIIELLVKYGADIHVSAKLDGRTVLHRACEAGHQSTVELCVNMKADVNAVLQNGETPLMTAIKSGKLEIVRLLVEHGANVNQEDKIGVTPLNLARSFGKKDIENFLKKSGATTDHEIEEKLIIWDMTCDNDINYIALAYSDFQTEDGFTHVLACGISDDCCEKPTLGYTTFYFRLKDGKVFDYCVGNDFQWDEYVMKSGKEMTTKFRRYVSLRQLEDRFSKINSIFYYDYEDWEIVAWKIKPAGISISELEEKQTQLSNFFSNYCIIEKDEIDMDDIPISFVFQIGKINAAASNILGWGYQGKSCNADQTIMDAIGWTIMRYLDR
jgi:hypothetical protein